MPFKIVQTVFMLNFEMCKICVEQFICDMIKRNESDVGDIVFEISAKTVFIFFCSSTEGNIWW